MSNSYFLAYDLQKIEYTSYPLDMSDFIDTKKISFLYLRQHESYDKYEALKLGITECIYNRNHVYKTGEISLGKFILVVEIEDKYVKRIEKTLQERFKRLKLHIYKDGGTEFFSCKIKDMILDWLRKTDIEHRILSNLEIDTLDKKIRLYIFKEKTANIKFRPMIKKLIDRNSIRQPSITKRPDQEETINKAYTWLLENDKCIICLVCGMGKTLISLWITEKLQSNTIVIGVPNLELLDQWYKILNKFYSSVPILCIYGCMSIKTIEDFLKNNVKCIVLTTYTSSSKVNIATKNINFKFDMKILDEVHHLTCADIKTNSAKTVGFIKMLDINSCKQIALTATLKELIGDDTISNKDTKYFGKIVEERSLIYAIDHGIICDYVIQNINIEESCLDEHFKKFSITDKTSKQLFLGAYVSLKSITDGYSHHILSIYNNTKNIKETVRYINLLLKHKYFYIPDLYYDSYFGELHKNTKKDILDKFNNSKYSILTCVNCLREGWDCPKLDAVVIGENMTSYIRIVQAILRACRKNISEPKKISKIILPIMLNNKQSAIDKHKFKTIIEVLYMLGLEDKNILSKVDARVIKSIDNITLQCDNISHQSIINHIEYDDKLTKELLLVTRRRIYSKISYRSSKKIIIESGIKSPDEYNDLYLRDCRLPENPKEYFRDEFVNWIDYLSTPKIYYSLEECKVVVRDLLKKYFNTNDGYDIMDVYKKLCMLDDNLPPYKLWVDYYKIKNLSEIITFPKKR